MPTSASPPAPTDWTDPDVCPFCEGELATPGAGFVDHLARSPACEAGFEQWRRRIGEDMVAGWSG